jgi:opacity protein-like surface antigen
VLPNYNTFRSGGMLTCERESRGVVGLAMLKLLIAGVASLAVTAPAMAADIEQPAPVPAYKAPLVAPSYYDWTGLYIGGFGSYSWSSTNSTLVNTTTGAAFGPTTRYTSAPHGGGQVGFDYMFYPARVVLGVVADVSSGEGFSNTVVGASGTSIYGSKTTESGTVRARLGYAFDRVLLYATGGWAWSNGSASRTQVTGTAGGAVAGTYETSNLAPIGWTVGAGVAFAIARDWNVFAEYRYTAFDSSATFPVSGFVTNSSTGVNTFKIGLNFELNGNPIGCPWYLHSC